MAAQAAQRAPHAPPGVLLHRLLYHDAKSADAQAEFFAAPEQRPLRCLVFTFLRDAQGFHSELGPGNPRADAFARLVALMMQRVVRGGQQKQAGLLAHVHQFSEDYAAALAPYAAADPVVEATLDSLLGCICRDDATVNPDPPSPAEEGVPSTQQHVHERLAFIAAFVGACLRSYPALPWPLLTAAFTSMSNGWSMAERSLRELHVGSAASATELDMAVRSALDLPLLGRLLAAVDSVPSATWRQLEDHTDLRAFEALLAMARVQMLWARMPEEQWWQREQQGARLQALSTLVREGSELGALLHEQLQLLLDDYEYGSSGSSISVAELHKALNMAWLALRMAGDALRLGLVSTPGLVVVFAQNLLSSWPDGDGMLLHLLCRLLLLLSQQQAAGEGSGGGAAPAAAESVGLKAAALLQWALQPGEHVHGMQAMIWHLLMDSGMLPSLLAVCAEEPAAPNSAARPAAFRTALAEALLAASEQQAAPGGELDAELAHLRTVVEWRRQQRQRQQQELEKWEGVMLAAQAAAAEGKWHSLGEDTMDGLVASPAGGNGSSRAAPHPKPQPQPALAPLAPPPQPPPQPLRNHASLPAPPPSPPPAPQPLYPSPQPVPAPLQAQPLPYVAAAAPTPQALPHYNPTGSPQPQPQPLPQAQPYMQPMLAPQPQLQPQPFPQPEVAPLQPLPRPVLVDSPQPERLGRDDSNTHSSPAPAQPQPVAPATPEPAAVAADADAELEQMRAMLLFLQQQQAAAAGVAIAPDKPVPALAPQQAEPPAAGVAVGQEGGAGDPELNGIRAQLLAIQGEQRLHQHGQQ